MATKTAIRKLLGNMGDADPINYGGMLVFEYLDGSDPLAEYIEAPTDDDWADGKYKRSTRWTIYTVSLDQCTYIDGVLSDNPFHPTLPAWFAESADRIASCYGVEHAEFVRLACSADPSERAQAYGMIGTYHGFDNLDSYPQSLTHAEVKARYKPYGIR